MYINVRKYWNQTEEYVHNRDFKTYTSANFTSAKASVVSELLSMTGRFLAASILTLTLPGMLR